MVSSGKIFFSNKWRCEQCNLSCRGSAQYLQVRPQAQRTCWSASYTPQHVRKQHRKKSYQNIKSRKTQGLMQSLPSFYLQTTDSLRCQRFWEAIKEAFVNHTFTSSSTLHAHEKERGECLSLIFLTTTKFIHLFWHGCGFPSGTYLNHEPGYFKLPHGCGS